VFTLETSNVQGEIERKFSKSRPKWAKFLQFLGSGGQGFLKVLIFTPKGTSLRGFTLFKPFCVKIQVDLQAGWGKNKEGNREVPLE